MSTGPARRPSTGASAGWIEDLAQLLPSIQIVSYVDDDPSDLSVYGLEPPEAAFSVSDGQNTLEFEIGAATDAGRFARYPEGRSVFVVSGVEPM